MGIIKATTGAVGGVLADQWLEMYYCDSIPQGILAQKGSKRIGPNSSNTKGSEDVISDGSIIVVNEGQCALVVEMGKVISVHDKPGGTQRNGQKHHRPRGLRRGCEYSSGRGVS